MHVVHTFNADHAKQGTVEELPDKAARVLIRTGRAREATDDEISSGRAAEARPADDQMPGGGLTATDQGPAAPSQPADPSTTTSAELNVPAGETPSEGKVTAVPKPGKPAGAVATTPSSPPAK